VRNGVSTREVHHAGAWFARAAKPLRTQAAGTLR
jgi:hypothetical protein